MDELYPLDTVNDEKKLLKLANELACNILPLETILNNLSIDFNAWETIRNNPRFNAYLGAAVEAWESATNVQERVKLKAGVVIEDVLPHLHERLVDKSQHLGQQVEGLKWLRDLAGLGPKQGGGAAGEKVSITINMGADQQLSIVKDVTPTIEADEDE